MTKEGQPPTPKAIKALRVKHGLSQAAAARLIWHSGHSWDNWENGRRTMHYALWDLFQRRLPQP